MTGAQSILFINQFHELNCLELWAPKPSFFFFGKLIISRMYSNEDYHQGVSNHREA